MGISHQRISHQRQRRQISHQRRQWVLKLLPCTCWFALLTIMAGIAQAEPVATASRPAPTVPADRYTYRTDHDPDGIGKFYMGREIAQVMGHQAADWLDRREREREEAPARLIRALSLKRGDVVVDLGAGSGFLTTRLARAIGPNGRVKAVDIQPEMLDIIRRKCRSMRIMNVDVILGEEADPKLEPASVDLVLMVDVYHEFEFPYEMMEHLVRALKPGGRIVSVEYREEDPTVPIKRLHKMSEAQVIKEMGPFPLRHVKTIGVLPRQHIIIFEKLADPDPKRIETITVFDLGYTLKHDHKDLQQVAKAWDHCHAVTTLQGIVNRQEPRLYVRYVNTGGIHSDDYWLQRMSEPGQWLNETRIEKVDDLLALIDRFRPAIKGAVIYDASVPATSNLASTIAGAEDLIAVRYDPTPDSLYHALVLEGPRLPVVRHLLNDDGSPMFNGRGTIPGTQMPSTGSAKCDAYLWLKDHYLDTGKLNTRFGAFYMDAHWLKGTRGFHPNIHTLSNHDYFVAKRGFFFDLSVWEDEPATDDPGQPPGTDLRTLKALLQSAYDHGGKDDMIHIGGFTPWGHKYNSYGTVGGKHDPVPTEWELVRIASAYNAFIDADALGFSAMANASFYTHFPLKPRYEQHWVTEEDLKRRGYLDNNGKVKVDGREFIIFYVGDYDSAAWIYQHLPVLWDHPARGRIPLMWCISPIVERRAPMALDYFYRTATENDYFATADNGAGYLNPGMLQEPRPISGLHEGLTAWRQHCEPFYRRWDMTITGFIIDGFAPGLNQAGLDCYASFSPNGIVPQQIPATLLHGRLPVLRADYDLTDAVDTSAARIIDRIRRREPLPFHWFRAILKSPEWYEQVYEQARTENPRIELLDGPTFFELYRRYLFEHPEAAAGQVDLPR